MSSKTTERQSRRTGSIARRINRRFWFKRLADTILFDLLASLLICGCFLCYFTHQAMTMEQENISLQKHDSLTNNQKDPDAASSAQDTSTDNSIASSDDPTVIHYFIHTDSELAFVARINDHPYSFDLLVYLPYVKAAVLVTLAIQGIHLFFALFHTSEIRRQLKPLNDLAIQAEQMSSMPFDPNKFASLEHAIENVSPNAPAPGIHTGDKDLESIEVALNNLLLHIQESQRQQARFVSDASHELRTPIAVIQGYVNMLDRWGRQDEAVLTESIEALKNESQHMKDLVEQLLFLARGDSGRQTLHFTTFDLNDVVREVWEESMMIDETHPYIFSECAGAFVSADLSMLKQSVRIFVQNASKYSRPGDTILLGVKASANTVSYIVQDEGIGVSDSQVVHIFERFYRSDEARNTETGGSGLGLSIAKWIVDAHAGVIEVLSRPEFGTRFTITFKRATR